jgi:LysM repeat protein
MIPQTARNYGLIVNSNVDERRDPLLEARATAKYLKDLHEEFGNWLWAINAYHSGENNLRKALSWADKNHPEKPEDFSGSLRQYQYLKVVSEFPYDKEFNDSKNLRYGPNSARYTTLFLAFLAGKEKLEESTTKDKAVNFDQYKIHYQKNYNKPHEVTIKSGDTLSAISYKYGISTDKIREQNNLDDSFIKTGQKLKLLIEEPPVTMSEFIDKLRLSSKEKEFVFKYNFSYKTTSKDYEKFINKKLYSETTINLPLGKLRLAEQVLENY